MGKCRDCGASVKYPTKQCPHCGKKMVYPVAGVAAVFCCLAFIFAVKFVLSGNLQNEPHTMGTSDSLSSPTSITTPMPTPITTDSEASSTTLGPGTYTVGKDIVAGTYDCIVVSGLGVLRGNIAAFGDPGFVQTMGSVSASVGDESLSIEAVKSYSNLTLTDGDVFYIEMSLNIEFVPK